MSLNETTGIALINTQANSGTIQLPNSLFSAGRVITFKDTQGTFQLSSFTLTTVDAQTIDSNISTIQRNKFGWTTLVAGQDTSWYTIGGTQITSLITSTVNTGYVSTGTLVFSNVSSISTLFFRDTINPQSNTLTVTNNILSYTTGATNTLVSGGARQSFGGLFLPVKA
jgi:hypothetical protein